PRASIFCSWSILTSPSSFSRLREISATLMPPRPNLRPMLRPSPGPAPTTTAVFIRDLQFRSAGRLWAVQASDGHMPPWHPPDRKQYACVSCAHRVGSIETASYLFDPGI